MSEYLHEDNLNTRTSLQEAQQIRDQSKLEMEQIEQANVEEYEDYEKQVMNLEKLMRESEDKMNAVKKENTRLQQAIQEGRDKDVHGNKKLVDSINSKDKELEKYILSIQKSCNDRKMNLESFNKECENASSSTKKTETMLKEKEQQREAIQQQKEELDKELSSKIEKNMEVQSLNYQLSSMHKFYSQKTEKTEKRLEMLKEKLQFMQSTMMKELQAQADHANQVDSELQ